MYNNIKYFILKSNKYFDNLIDLYRFLIIFIILSLILLLIQIHTMLFITILSIIFLWRFTYNFF